MVGLYYDGGRQKNALPPSGEKKKLLLTQLQVTILLELRDGPQMRQDPDHLSAFNRGTFVQSQGYF